MIIGMISMSRYSLFFREILKKFIRELRGVANHVNTKPNSLGRMDKHKVGKGHKQMHPSMIGKIDMLEYSKDVGQSGMISPYTDSSTLFTTDINKYPNIKFELYEFVQKHFPNPHLSFNASNIVEYNMLLDKLAMNAYIDLDYNMKDRKRIIDDATD